MICKNCGSALPDEAKFCQKCGASTSQPTPQAQAQPNRPYYPPGTHPYHKLGGFLMVLVVFGFIGGIGGFLNAIRSFLAYKDLLWVHHGVPFSFTAFMWFLMIASVLIYLATGTICFSGATMIQRKDSDTMRFLQSSSFTMMIVNTAFHITVFVWLDQYKLLKAVDLAPLFLQFILTLIGWGALLIISIFYFSKSVRVRTYLGSDEYMKKSKFNKRTVPPVPADGSDMLEHEKQVEYQKEHRKEWFCAKCGAANSHIVKMCVKCGEPMPE